MIVWSCANMYLHFGIRALRVVDYKVRIFGMIKSLKYLDKVDANENDEDDGGSSEIEEALPTFVIMSGGISIIEPKPKPGNPEAKKLYAIICVTIPIAKPLGNEWLENSRSHWMKEKTGAEEKDTREEDEDVLLDMKARETIAEQEEGTNGNGFRTLRVLRSSCGPQRASDEEAKVQWQFAHRAWS
eukprot:Gb_37765 [translate_table: standard]